MKYPALFCLAVLSLSASAAQVYDSPQDDGTPGGVRSIADDGSTIILNLYIDGGLDESASVDKCTGEGDGDELCAWQVTVSATGGAVIADATAEFGVVLNNEGNVLRANGLDPFNPAPGPRRIGSLTVSSVGAGDIVLSGGLAVRSDLAGDPLGVTLLASTDAEIDTDGDGIGDSADNCTLVANSDQRDSNDDGFGNVCDPDLNNDLVINVVDLGLLRSVFFTADEDADFNGDGVVNVVDLGVLRQRFFGAPGPSGQAQ